MPPQLNNVIENNFKRIQDKLTAHPDFASTFGSNYKSFAPPAQQYASMQTAKTPQMPTPIQPTQQNIQAFQNTLQGGIGLAKTFSNFPQQPVQEAVQNLAPQGSLLQKSAPLLGFLAGFVNPEGSAKNIASKIHPDDLNVMRDVVDYMHGGYNLLTNSPKDARTAMRLEQDAWRLAEHYGINGAKTLKSLANKFDNIIVKADNAVQNTFTKGAGGLFTGSTKAISPLAQEAIKYKSAEDFVKAQQPVYHGSPVELKQFHNKSGVFFTDNFPDASGFGGNPDHVYEGYLNFKKPLVIDAKGAKWDALNTKYGKSTQEIIGNAQKDGYDGIVFKNIVDNVGDTADVGGQSTISYAYKPKNAFLNESQLTDIYNQAKKAK